MITLYIGYEDSMPTNYHVMVSSILKHTSSLVNIIPLQTNLIKEYKRPYQENQSTSFSFSRFLVPYLNNYGGWAIFMDSDMLFMDDISKLWNSKQDNYDVQVVQHESYSCDKPNKFFNIKQTNYRRKNWSSVMLFNCNKCRTLTPEYVNTASAADLHELNWANNIGKLEPRWNFLVGEQEEIDNPAVLHYTYGTPKYNECSYYYSNIWDKEQKRL